MKTITRKATIRDIKQICQFVDFWMSGRGKRFGAPGAVDDFFVSPTQHKRYIEKENTTIVFHRGRIIAWTVILRNGSLVHLLVSGYFRGQCIGSTLIESLNPPRIHSKMDQSTGDPGPFYEKLGYKFIERIKSHSRIDIDKIRPNRKPNIDIYERRA